MGCEGDNGRGAWRSGEVLEAHRRDWPLSRGCRAGSWDAPVAALRIVLKIGGQRRQEVAAVQGSPDRGLHDLLDKSHLCFRQVLKAEPRVFANRLDTGQDKENCLGKMIPVLVYTRL